LNIVRNEKHQNDKRLMLVFKPKWQQSLWFDTVATQSLQYNYNKPQILNHLPERES